MDNNYFEMIFTARGTDLDTIQIIARTIILFLYLLVLFRIAKKRFMANSTPVDISMGVILGSVMSRGINGSATLFPTMAVGLAFLFCHWFLTLLISKSLLSKLIEGVPHRLMKDGILDRASMAKAHISEEDIIESTRFTAQVDTIDKVVNSYLENSGKISVILKENK